MTVNFIGFSDVKGRERTIEPSAGSRLMNFSAFLPMTEYLG